MARTPSMSIADAEAVLGPRGTFTLTTENRPTLRKWLTANGLPGLFVAGLSKIEQEKAYNYDSALQAIRDKLARNADSEASEEVTTEQTESASPPTTNQDTQIQRIAGLLGELLARPGVDENAVNKIIDGRWHELPSLIAKHAQHTISVEIKKHDAETVTITNAHKTMPTLIQAMGARQANGKHPNIMLVGPTGSGKTHAVQQAAHGLGKGFHTNGAISMDHQLIGFRDAAGNYHDTPFRRAFAEPAVYLFDEIDSSDNSPLLCLAGALANSHFAFPDIFAERHPDSVIIAAGNTFGLGATADFVGRNKLDAAIRSRFPVRISWDYDESLERQMSGNVDWACRVQSARAKAKAAGLKIIIDPRMSQAGAALIAAGLTDDQAASMTYLADLSPEQRQIIEA